MSSSDHMIDRFLYPCAEDVGLDANGLLLVSDSFLKYTNLIALDQFVKLPGAILLAEGGMGKSTLMQQLKNRFPNGPAHLIEPALFKGDPSGLREDLDSFLGTPPCLTSTGIAIIVDGLDEAPELAGTILRCFQGLPATATIWIASRDIAALRSILTEWPQLASYTLAPLSEQDISKIATNDGSNGDDFLQAIAQHGVAGICAKPLGCKLVLSGFQKNALEGMRQMDLWHQGIKRLCDETPSKTKALLPPRPYSLDQIMNCSAWMALCLALSESIAVWNNEPSHCPEQCLSISDIVSEEFSSELIRATLERGVFSPLGDGRIRFSHAVYRDYLAAYGFTQFIPPVHWPSLLLQHGRKGVSPQRAGIAAWLSAYNKGFLDELSGLQPEILLSSMDAVQTIGPSKLCVALLDRADAISYRQRHSPAIANNLSHLASIETSRVIRDRLLDDNASAFEIEFAIEIAEECQCTDLSDILADRVLNTALPLRQRIDASYAVSHLADETAQGRLKELLPIDPAGDPQDALRGNILHCCWPKHLTPIELTTHLIPPQKASYSGSYSYFLNYYLPKSFASTIDERNASDLLSWSLMYLNKQDSFYSLGRLACAIYTYCWQWAANPYMANLLAIGYLNAVKIHRFPFLDDRYSYDSKSILFLSRDAFMQDTLRRFTVLDAILQSDIEVRDFSYIPVKGYPLYSSKDAGILFDKILEDPNGPLADKWGACIRAIISRVDLDQYAEEIDRLCSIRPDLIDSTQKIKNDLEEACKHAKELTREWKKKEKERKLQQQADQGRIDSEIKNALQLPYLAPERFCSLAAWLHSENGRRLLGFIDDLTKSLGWGKLSPEEQDALIALAEHYLFNGTIEPTNPNQLISSVHQALTLLRTRNPGRYQTLPDEVWRKCSVELLKAAIGDNMEHIGPLFDTLSKNFSGIAEDALINVLRQNLVQKNISIICHWGPRLTNKQAQAILQIAKDPNIDAEQSYLILKELVNQGQVDLVRIHLDKLFNGDWKLPLNQELYNHLLLAFVLSPHRYVHQILGAMKKGSVWGKRWIEMAVMDWERKFGEALFACDPEAIADFYTWVRKEYPLNTRPENEEADWQGPLDKIYEIQNHLINFLVQSGAEGSTAALEKIQISFPENTWLQHCVIDARINEQATKIPILDIADIKMLREKTSASRRLINSIQDLHELVAEKLNEYQEYLQGDTPAVGDLWNIVDSIRPRDEEYLSNHLKRFLDLTIKSGVVINREVQIRRKLYKDGTPGSRTDLWIQAIDQDGQSCTLCIEVKCNWNPSAQTALKGQLIDKYMSGATAEAGILLLGWFACEKWDNKDNRQSNSTETWMDITSARTDLQNQAGRECGAGPLLSAAVIDCSLI